MRMNTTIGMTRSAGEEPFSRVDLDMSRRILRALADDFSARIIASTIGAAKTVEDISGDEMIPLSTCYRRVRELVEEGLVLVERIVITATGKRYALYRSCFTAFHVSSGRDGTTVEVELNPEVAGRVRSQKLSLMFGDAHGGPAA